MVGTTLPRTTLPVLTIIIRILSTITERSRIIAIHVQATSIGIWISPGHPGIRTGRALWFHVPFPMCSEVRVNLERKQPTRMPLTMIWVYRTEIASVLYLNPVSQLGKIQEIS